MLDYFKSCVDCETPAEVDNLTTMIEDATDVTIATIRKHCAGFTDWAAGIGYETNRRRGLVIEDDYHVSYHRSKYNGERCYYVRWSAIEFIWM
jgi:hypothetical protein